MLRDRVTKAKLQLIIFYDVITVSSAFAFAYFTKRFILPAGFRGLAYEPNYYGILAMLIISSTILFFLRPEKVKLIIESRVGFKQIIIHASLSILLATFLMYVLKIENISRLLLFIFGIYYTCLWMLFNRVVKLLKSLPWFSNLYYRNYIMIAEPWFIDLMTKNPSMPLGSYVHITSIPFTFSYHKYAEADIDLALEGNLRKDINDALQRTIVDGIIMPLGAAETAVGQVIVQLCQEAGVTIHFLAQIGSLEGYAIHADTINDMAAISLNSTINDPNQFLKYVLDYALAIVALVLFAPVMILAAISIKIVSPNGPVFFTQQRVGLNRRLFKLYKFRTMVPDAEAKLADLKPENEMDGPVFKLTDDPRILPYIGHFMRKTSIDELPQLFNVLRGDMSLVGPRPPIPREVQEYPLRFHKRLSVRPGLTCLWQCAPNRNDIKFDEWMMLDNQYINNWSIKLDITILIRTIKVVLTAQGK